MVESHHLPIASACPNCAKILDMATGIGSASPKRGDLTICVSCGVLLSFTDGLRLRPVTREELLNLPDDFGSQIELYREALEIAAQKKVRLN